MYRGFPTELPGSTWNPEKIIGTPNQNKKFPEKGKKKLRLKINFFLIKSPNSSRNANSSFISIVNRK
jgi:hypothetical protein